MKVVANKSWFTVTGFIWSVLILLSVHPDDKRTCLFLQVPSGGEWNNQQREATGGIQWRVLGGALHHLSRTHPRVSGAGGQ